MLTVGICKNLSDVKMMDQENHHQGKICFISIKISGNEKILEYLNERFFSIHLQDFGNDTKFTEGKHIKF